MTKRDDIKKKIKEEEEMSSGEGTLGSGSADLESDDDAADALGKVIGHSPVKGRTLGDESEEATKNRDAGDLEEEDQE